jgi:hypothetical protein
MDIAITIDGKTIKVPVESFDDMPSNPEQQRGGYEEHVSKYFWTDKNVPSQ